MQDIESSRQLLRGLELSKHVVLHKLKGIEVERKQIELSLADGKKRLELILLAGKVLQEVADKVSTENFKKIEFLVNRALSSIFTDLNLEFKIETSVKRGNPVYSFLVYKDGIPGTINSLGGGIVVVVSVVLKLIFNVISTRFPVLVLDETLSFLATHYIPNMSQFLKDVAKEFGIPIVMVTHQSQFASASDVCYSMEIEAGSSQLRKVEYEEFAD